MTDRKEALLALARVVEKVAMFANIFIAAAAVTHGDPPLWWLAVWIPALVLMWTPEMMDRALSEAED